MQNNWRPYFTHDTTLVINFGGQYAHLIARRVRELKVYSEIIHYADFSEETLREIKPKAIILSGSPLSPPDIDPSKLKVVLRGEIPVLGICYGHQLLAYMLGGTIAKGPGEYGKTLVKIVKRNALFENWNQEEVVWMSHRDQVKSLPEALEILAVSVNNVIAAFKVKNKPIYGVQFHPEVSHTPKGLLLLKNFLYTIAKCKASWNPQQVIEKLVSEIKAKVGSKEKVLCAVSGGVDSTVTAALVQRAIGDRLVAVFVDHGLLREGEVEITLNLLKRLKVNYIFVNAKERFLFRLKGVKDPEEKRKIIGEEFAKIFKEIVERDSSIKWLAQGTIYPDVIESGKVKHSARIKSHHNVAGLPKWFNLKLIEPLKYFYKDEVRQIAKALDLPDSLIKKHPFPGPGLAVRIIGEVNEKKLEIVRKASKIVEEELKKNGIYDKVWQAFAVVGEDKWVGVKGDKRAEGYIVTIRIVESIDGMTADYAKLPYSILEKIASRIYNEIDDVTMVTYAITPKPPSTIEPC
ncbi:MAG: GMP synthase (glutamine-hydrolyzing) [Thermoprotei archaeon]|nr:MAG: GMP synthase (glutamine-hydrolyzing) [Thermoprotei archaeon]